MHQLQRLRAVLQALDDPLEAPFAARKENRSIQPVAVLNVGRRTVVRAALVYRYSTVGRPVQCGHL